jgi:tRNA dimethylallyltransferase
MGYTQNDPGLKTIGYVQLIDFLLGRVSKEQAIEEWTVREIQYAKRQLTFMKSNPQIVWQYV